jgi:hypothetical protein
MLQAFEVFGVADGARTHDNRNHNPVRASSIYAGLRYLDGNFYGKTVLGSAQVYIGHFP